MAADGKYFSKGAGSGSAITPGAAAGYMARFRIAAGIQSLERSLFRAKCALCASGAKSMTRGEAMTIIWKNGLILFGVVFVFSAVLGNLYPVRLVLTQLINSSIGILATGLILSLAWTRWPVIR